MFKTIETLGITSNIVIGLSDLRELSTAESLRSLTVAGAQFAKGFKLDYLYLNTSNELQVINLSSSNGLDISNTVFPDYWADFTQLYNINMAHCGFSDSQVEKIVVALKNIVEAGLSQAVVATTSKVFTITGNNGKPTSADFVAAKNYLIAKGWTINHN